VNEGDRTRSGRVVVGPRYRFPGTADQSGRHRHGVLGATSPSVGTAVGLVGGLVVFLFGPLPTLALNRLAGGALLAVAVAT